MMRYLMLYGGLLFALSSFAEELGPRLPVWMVSAECRMVLLPQKAAIPLIAEFSDDEKADAAWDKVQAMLVSGEATLSADLAFRGTDYRVLTSQAVEEVHYATQLQPPTLPDRFPTENAVEVLKAWPIVGVVPFAFETRNVGETIELEPRVLGDGKWLDATVDAEHVRLLRWDKIDNGRLANGEHLTGLQPCFHAMKSVLRLRVRNGQKVLLGVHKAPEAEKTFEFFLLRISAVPAGSR